MAWYSFFIFPLVVYPQKREFDGHFWMFTFDSSILTTSKNIFIKNFLDILALAKWSISIKFFCISRKLNGVAHWFLDFIRMNRLISYPDRLCKLALTCLL